MEERDKKRRLDLVRIFFVFILAGLSKQTPLRNQRFVNESNCITWMAPNKCKECRSGFVGSNCEWTCRFPSFGKECQGHCHCEEKYCNSTFGCKDNAPPLSSSIPPSTVNKFSEVYFSTKTQALRATTEMHIVSDKFTHAAVCPKGYMYVGNTCDMPCRFPSYGVGCQSKCDCEEIVCNHVMGCNARRATTDMDMVSDKFTPAAVCPKGYFGKTCDMPCRFPSYGIGCLSKCDCEEIVCNHVMGCSATEPPMLNSPNTVNLLSDLLVSNVCPSQPKNNNYIGLNIIEVEPTCAEDNTTTVNLNVPLSTDSTQSRLQICPPVKPRQKIKADDVTRMQYEVLVEQKKKLQEQTTFYRLMNRKLRMEMGLPNED